MPSIPRTSLSFVLFLFCIGNTCCIYFCDVQSFDTIFNIGPLIYFLRCGEMWTYDPNFNGGEGGLIRDYSPLVIAKDLFAKEMVRKTGNWSPKELNITGFSFQGLNCNHKRQDSRGSCTFSIQEWNHLTFLMAYQLIYVFDYDNQYTPRIEGVPQMQFKFNESLAPTKAFPQFFPNLTAIASEFSHFKVEKMEVKFALFDSAKNYLYLAIKHEEYHCITYINMEKMLFDTNEWPAWVIPKNGMIKNQWIKANCFAGKMHGMFFHKDQTYIVGQVLTENRVFDDQVYKIFGDGLTRPQFQQLSARFEDYYYKPQNVRNFFGCSSLTTKNNLRKKRSLHEPTKIERQKVIRIAKRVANNLLIQFMASVLVLVLVYKLVVHRFGARIPNKVFNKLF